MKGDQWRLILLCTLPFSLLAFRTFLFQQDSPAQAREAFLAEDAGPSNFLVLLSFRELLAERPVQMKVFRALASENPPIFQAAVTLCLNAPELESLPAIKRRFNLIFLGQDAQKMRSILELVRQEREYLLDLRVVSLISEALYAETPLQGLALSLVKEYPELRTNAAVAEALARLPEQADEVRLQLPDYDLFKEKIEPFFYQPGADGKSCGDCHKSHPIFRLIPPEEVASREEQLKDHYRNALRVVNLQNPENSLIVRKPTLPESETPSAQTHGGGVRFDVGSLPYQTILEWVQTGAPSL